MRLRRQLDEAEGMENVVGRLRLHPLGETVPRGVRRHNLAGADPCPGVPPHGSGRRVGGIPLLSREEPRRRRDCFRRNPAVQPDQRGTLPALAVVVAAGWGRTPRWRRQPGAA
jgi:hypothetical protein